MEKRSFSRMGEVRKVLFLIIFAMEILSPISALAQSEDFETMGRFRFLDLFLSPRLRLQEPGNGGFELEQSYLGFEWSRDEFVRAVFKYGTADLVRPAIWYPQVTSDFALTEGWIELRGELGDVRAGLLTVPLGFEGTFKEWNSVLPESHVRRKGWLVKRDYGIQFRWEARPWATQVTVHNGESGPNSDRWVWTSGLWQYRSSEGFGMLLTASVGHTRVDSTSGSVAQTQEGFNFDPNESSKIRYGTFALFKEDRRNLFLLEGGRGEIIQGASKGPYAWGRFDLSWNFAKDTNLLARYEQTQSNLEKTQTIVKSTGLGFVFSSRDNLQSITFYGARNVEDPSVQNDEYWVIFRLHSSLLR